jgi:beta-phosphoglucomutase
MIKNIIFDLNGTMIFDGKYHEIAWKEYSDKLAGRILTTEEFQHHVLGHTNRDILEYLMGKGTLSDERILELTEEKEAAYRDLYVKDTENFKLVDGLEEYLDYIKEKGININIATGSNLTNLDFYFEQFKLDRWFDKSKAAYDDGTMAAKPAPDMYIRAMERIGAAPEETMVIEDGPSGVKAAAAAGAAFIVGIYGDYDETLLKNTCLCNLLIHDYVDQPKLRTIFSKNKSN